MIDHKIDAVTKGFGRVEDVIVAAGTVNRERHKRTEVSDDIGRDVDFDPTGGGGNECCDHCAFRWMVAKRDRILAPVVIRDLLDVLRYAGPLRNKHAQPRKGDRPACQRLEVKLQV